MDPITHGIAGALLGKGFLSKRDTRVAIFSATLGAVFPDVDVIAEAISRDPLAIVKYHRSITHSFVALPVFAMLLAWLTRWIARRCGIESPSWGMLTLIYGVGIASHIVLDAMTSFGTRIWSPISQQRVAWDLLFIIDFSFTSVVLLPQVVAWIYSDRQKSRGRAARMWGLFTLAVVAVWALTRAFGAPFHPWVAAAASAVMAALFFFPAARGWGFRVTRAAWCRAGTYATIAYLCACGMAHHAAMRRVQDFAAVNHITVDRMAALPIPPSLLDWGDAIRSAIGVYQAQFDLRDPHPTVFHFTPDSPRDPFTARAMELPEVQLYWHFARFPVIRTSIEDGQHIVDLGENRFMERNNQVPQPFTYRVIFDADGNIIAEGWRANGLLQRYIRRMTPPRAGEAR